MHLRHHHHPLSLLPILFPLLALASILNTASGHDHEKLHSHFCEGGGYSIFCPENQTLRIDKAWYGRVAHDGASCVNDTSPQQDLAEDCGSSLLDSKSSWCQKREEGAAGGCTIAVKDMAPEVEEKACPEGVVRYLYLEYECLGGEGSGGMRVAASTCSRVLIALAVIVLCSLLDMVSVGVFF